MSFRRTLNSIFSARGKLRYGRVLVFLLLFFGVAGFSFGVYLRRPEITSAMRGKRVAEQMGCFACHGPEGFGGVPDPVSAGGRAPGWEHGMASLFIRGEGEIEEWILHGETADSRSLREAYGSENLVPMPAYEGLVSESGLKDLKAYFIAVSEYYPDMPDEAYEGSVVAKALGCFGCHGASGMGGMANPGSFTGIIPSWDGEHFDDLVKDDAELEEWIMEGTIRRLREHPIGSIFLERQTIQMPAYEQHVSEADLKKLMIYIKWLRGHEAKNREADNPIA